MSGRTTTSAAAGRAFPRGALLGAGALVGLALLSAAFARPAPLAPGDERDVVVSRNLRFEDRSDGSVSVYEAPSGGLVATMEPGSNGFARALLRGIARDRKRRGVGPEVPFTLALRGDGALVLIDPVTERTVELQAFGPTNAETFGNLLVGSGRTQ